MKNKQNENKSFGAVEMIFMVVLVGLILIFGPELANQTSKCAEQTKAPEQQEEKITEIAPLVIESTEWTPHGVFEGTIVISGDGIEESGYEGIMYIEPDGDRARISCTGAIRSRYGELF